MSHVPYISVVTPVYNGAKYLAQCIESVLSQTHDNLEYVILDNASTDGTGEIAHRYALRDTRIRVHHNSQTLPLIQNWNRAMSLIGHDSEYTKILHADDTIYPQCLAKMSALGERHPDIGIIGTPRLRGTYVECSGLPSGQERFDGREIARLFLRQEIFAFAPTSGMIRSDLVRERGTEFYPSQYLHADLAVYFELLAHHDFGFLDEVLSFSRVHPDSITNTVAQRKQTIFREWLVMLHHYGPRFFEKDELKAIERAFLRRYYRVLVRGWVTGRDREFFAYHLQGLRDAQREPDALDLVRATGTEVLASLARPGKLFRTLKGA